MKFEQMQYARPDFDAARETFASLRARIAAAPERAGAAGGVPGI